MFTYLKPGIRERLVNENKLFRIDVDGNRLDAEVAGSSGQRIVNLLGPIPLPLARGEEHTTANWYATVRATELAEVENLASNLRERGGQHLFAGLASSMAVNSVREIGTAAASASPLVRVHSNCLTGDIFGSMRCECGPQLDAAIDRIARDPEGGYIVYMAGHEGRGIGLWAKAATYLLQDAGENTYQANRSLGLPDDSRDFSDAAYLLDMDLSILGAPWSTYQQYAQAIRQEYAHVADDNYRDGRTAVLQGLLAHPKLYLTDYYYSQLEAQARDNIKRELISLAAL